MNGKEMGWVAVVLLAGISIAADAFARNIVQISPEHVLIINGRKVFPIGFTMPPPPDGVTPWGRNGFEELADAGATTLRTGPWGQDWTPEAFALEDKYMDAAARYGLYCMPYLREFSGIEEADLESEQKLRALILRYRDHPGMGVWKGADEPEWGNKPVEPLVRTRHIIQELDPRPIWIVQAPRGTVRTLRAYDPTYDITGIDIYPIGYPPGMHSRRPNKNISMVGDYTQMIMRVADGRKPVWMTLQICWSGVLNPGRTLRFPTFPEQRYMSYQAIINGARGLVYFGGHIGTPLRNPEANHAMSPEDDALGWNWTFWRNVMRPVLEEIGTKSPLYPALLVPDSELPIKCVGGLGVEFVVREVEDEIFILAAKREGATINVTFTGLPAGIEVGDVMYESPRKVQVENGEFSDWFAPFDVHVYRFKRK